MPIPPPPRLVREFNTYVETDERYAEEYMNQECQVDEVGLTERRKKFMWNIDTATEIFHGMFMMIKI